MRVMVSIAAFLAYLATIPLANWMIGHVGTQVEPGGPHVIAVLPGLYAPSGVLMVGAALFLRDVVQDRLGVRWGVAAVAGGAAVSWWLASPFLAVASGAAFLVSEMLDLVLYTPLRRRGWHPVAVLASGLVGSVADSVAFLLLAFGNLQFVEGQVVGKAAITLGAAAIVWLVRPAASGGGAPSLPVGAGA